MNRTGSKILHGLLLATSGLVGSTIIASTAAMAGGGPTGGTVAVGSATIVNASPTQTVVNQSSKKALINWNSFSIPGGSSVKFNQPNSKSLTVNRVTGPNASTIDGALLANGNVWLINANGVLFGKGSQINVGALLATTSDLSDDDFKAGKYAFKPATNPNAAVVNKGTITAGANGSVVLSAPRVSNEGLIQANLGTVVLGGAKAFTVDMTGDNLLRYQVTAPVTSAPKDANGSVAAALVSNSGAIEAAGGHVMMTARAARNVENNVINNTGMVEATSVSSHNGVIDLDAGPNGTVNDSGVLNASGSAQGQTGGTVNVTGGTVNIADGAKINASGNAGGGTIQIGGGLHGQGDLAHAQRTIIGKATIAADATNKGNGGTVAVWSDSETSFAGSISARGGAKGGNGGQVETSGHTLGVAASAKVDTTAPLGLTGDWLLDPDVINIVGAACGTPTSIPGNGTLTTATDAGQTDEVETSAIIGALSSTNVTLEASTAINVEADLTYSSSHTLSLLSEGGINVDASIQNSGTGGLNLIAGWDGITTNFSGVFPSNAYGQNDGDVVITGSNVAVGSKGGRTLVAGESVQFGQGFTETVRLGYLFSEGSSGGGGDIQILAPAGIAFMEDATVYIGNGNAAGNITSPVTGDISINAGTLAFNTGSQVKIGNANGSSVATASGSVSIIATNIDEPASEPLETSLLKDIQYGDVFFGLTNDSFTFDLNTNNFYTSSHDLTLAVSGDLTVLTSIQNSGSGNISLVAGWNGIAVMPASIVSTGAYGANGSIYVGGFNGDEIVSVGSASGTTLLAAQNVDIETFFDNYTQVGYHGDGGGNITVLATDSLTLTGGEGGVAQIGNGSFDVSGNVTGNISVNAGSILLGASDDNMLTLIGHVGGDSSLFERGNITITAGAIEMDANGTASASLIGHLGGASSSQRGAITVTTDASLTGGEGAGDINMIALGGSSLVQIGHGSWNDSTGGAVGTINISADGALRLYANADNTLAVIGNGGSDFSTGGTVGGDIAVFADSVDVWAGPGGTDDPEATADFAQARIGNRGTGAVSGNIDVESTDGNIWLEADSTGLASIGNGVGGIDQNGTVTGSAAGSTKVISAEDLLITAYDSGQARIANGYAANSPITVTAHNDIILKVLGDPGQFDDGSPAPGQAFIGNFGNGQASAVGGDITVTSTHGFIELYVDQDGAFAGIGNLGGLVTTGGNITVSALDSTNGYVSLVADTDAEPATGNDITYDAVVQIGNGAASGTVSGNININSGSYTSLSALGDSSLAQIGNGATTNDTSTGASLTRGNITVTSGGDVSLSAAADSARAQIGNGDPTHSTAGNVSGDISIKAAATLDLWSSNNGAFWIGNTAALSSGYTETGNLTMIMNSGVVYSDFIAADLNGGNVFLGWNGNDIYWYDFAYNSPYAFTVVSTGNVNILGNIQNSGTGNITYVAGWDGHTTALSSLTHSGVYGNNGKTLTIGGASALGNTGIGSKGGTTNILTGSLVISSNVGNAQVGYAGAATGAINILATGDILVESEGANTVALIGNGGFGVTGAVKGNIAINAGGNISVLTNATSSAAEIGNTGGDGSSQSGNITINATGKVSVSATQATSTAQIGNRQVGTSAPAHKGNASGNIVINAGSILVSASGTNTGAQIGNGSNLFYNQNASGNITVKTSGAVDVQATKSSSLARIGNAGVNASGNIAVAAAKALTIAQASGASSRIGSFVSGGTLSGNVAVTASSVDGITDSIFNDLTGGDFTLNSLGTKTLEIDDTGSYSSSHNLKVTSGGDIIFDTSLQNSGSGNITFVSAGDVTIGGSRAAGDVAVGSKSGTTTIVADSLLLSAVKGYAQLGYHGGGSGAISAAIAGDVTLNGGGRTGYYAQIGNGGYKVSGSSSELISVIAGGDIALAAGAGQEAYVQIGNGGAESNSNSGGYSETGLITVVGDTLTLSAGSGAGSYVQIGHGGYKAGQSLHGTATLGGNISVAAATAIKLIGGGDDAYAQIGNGGNFVNNNAANGANGTTSGDIAVIVAAPNTGQNDPLTLTAGTGINSFAQIGNGGQGENTPAAGATVSFDISGDVVVADLTLTGSNTGANGYAQIGNGDISKTGTGNVSGSVTLGQGTKITSIAGTAPGAGVGMGNATGFGTVTGTPVQNGVDAGTQGSVASITQNQTGPTNFNIATIGTTPGFVQPTNIDTAGGTQGPTPLEQLAQNSENDFTSDGVAHSVGQSLGEGKTIYVTSKTLIPGVLKQIVTLTPNKPHGVPPADVDYSSWGNEALWRW